MSSSSDININSSTFYEIIDIVKGTVVDMSNFNDIINRVDLVETLEKTWLEYKENRSKEWKQGAQNRKRVHKLEDEYKDFIISLSNSFDVSFVKIVIFLKSIIHLFPDWNPKYLIVSSVYYLSTKKDFCNIAEKWDLLEKYDLPVSELIFFYSTIVKNREKF